MAQLPPKIPNMTPHWPDFSQKLSHFSTAAASSAVQNPSWVDEFLDFSACRRGNHRRSISDSIAFLEAPIVTSHMEEHNFDKFDDEQFMSMFTEDDDDLRNNRSHNNKNVGPSGCSLNTSTQADHKSFNDDEEPPSDHYMKDNNNNRNDEVRSQCKTEPEDGTASSNNSGDSSNRIIDPKRVKRILANRQSAQRSRVRKLQYISELERSVTSLQSEVSVLSPRVAFLDHQRLLLNVDNSALKQRIAALAQDKIFKDAHQESLKREIERLRQVYQQQSFKKMENANHSPETGVDIKLSIEKEQMLNI
ncbi:hypothetical protein F2Q69_00002122 [Brassica cretica]|uniref:BZIP domain-containing protein n=1 Tax=Brassica cretica TaxID=69181 RepID=A0A8S9NT35_BRACR|nr:hypothetical protein F2Q69_00002122 [Brassica cretica]